MNSSLGVKMGHGANCAMSVPAGEKRPKGSTLENRGVVEQLAHMAGRSVEQLGQAGGAERQRDKMRRRYRAETQRRGARRQGRQPAQATAQLPLVRFRWSLRGVVRSRALGLVVRVAKNGSLGGGHGVSTIGGAARKTGDARFVPLGRQDYLPTGWTSKARSAFSFPLSALALVIGAWALVIPAPWAGRPAPLPALGTITRKASQHPTEERSGR